MASTCSTDSALDFLQWMEDKMGFKSSALLILKVDLRFLRTFLRCARKWSNNDVHYRKSDDNEEVSLGSFLLRIEDVVDQNVQVMKSLHLGSEDGRIPDGQFNLVFSKFHETIESFAEEITGLYTALLDRSSKITAPKRDELMEFLDSLLQNIRDFNPWDMKKEAEDLEEKLAFMKNIICYAAMLGVEDKQLEDLICHTQVAASNAAHLYYANAYVGVDGMNTKISELLQKIKPVESQICETYTQVLRVSKLSGSSKCLSLKIDKHILRDFIDSVRGNFWEILNSSPKFMDSVKDRLPLIYEGLSFLRNILREQHTMFDELHEQTRNLIGDVVSEAGVISCSLFAKETEEGFLAKDINLGLSNLMKKIRVIKLEVAEKDPLATRSNFPRINDLGFINLLLENLDELLSNGAAPIVFEKDQIKIVQEDLIFIRSFMEDIAELRREHEEVQILWSRVMDVVYKVEFFIDSLVITNHLSCFPMLLNTITEEIKILKSKALEIHGNEKYDFGEEKSTKASSYMQSQVSIPIINEVVVDLDDEEETIIDLLTRGTSELDIVSIIGMPGLGKTTLAKKVYNDPSVLFHFHIRVWSCVSQQYRMQNLLLHILEEIFDMLPDRFSMMNEDDLFEELYKCLKRKRYLIILDDVWDVAVWNDFGRVFPNDSNGSRILLTSRLHNVALHANPNRDANFLRPLTDDESWELLKKKLFHEEDCPPNLCELGMQIAKICKGLPLSIVVVAGILATMEQHLWAEVLGSLSSDMLSATEQCMSTLELSYNHLPDYLKPCLLYFGEFPEDQEVPICKLMWLWIAEGLVPKSHLKSLEDVAEDCMNDLLGRSLVMVAKQSSRGGIKACHIHDLLREFCNAKAKEENFVQMLQEPDDLSMFYEPQGLRRLCIYSEPEHLRKSRLFCPHIHTLSFFNTDKNWHARDPSNVSFIFQFSKLLKVLNLEKIKIGEFFPSEIELLVQLRYLAVCGDMYFIPSSISKLWNLETFLLEGFSPDILLPDTIWDMKKLRHLHINKRAVFSLPNDHNLENSGLYNLDTLSTASVHIGPEMEKILKMFPNIRRLKCRFSESWDCNGILALDFLNRLESIRVISNYDTLNDFQFVFPQNLKKLTLSQFLLPWTEISVIGKLPNLEVLKLLSAFQGEIWDIEEESFPKLKFLKLEFSDIVRLTTSCDDFLSCLEKLVFRNCWNLEEVPSTLGDIPALKIIEVYRCHHSLASIAMQVKEEQVDLGNEDLNILIHGTGNAAEDDLWALQDRVKGKKVDLYG